MKIILINLIAVFCWNSLNAHPGHTDPVLAELNDYLMAIQIMRIDDPRAAEIFKTWHELRTASWKIREMTDEQNLLISASQVMDQVSATRAKQKQLLDECRSYFAGLIEQQPTIRIALGEEISTDWSETMIEVPRYGFKLVLIEIQNEREVEAEVSMRAKPNDNILFWNKKFKLSPQASRFTYLVCAPLNESTFSSTIQVSDSQENQAGIHINLKGMKSEKPPYTLIPGESTTKVVLPKTTDEPESVSDAKESIEFRITDGLGNPVGARVEVRDADGKAYWYPLRGPSFGVGRSEGSFATTLWKHQPGPYFYVGGLGGLDVNPAGKTATIYKGFEFKPLPVEVPKNGEVKAPLKRWINMSERGWYSGHTHIHTTDVGMPVQFNKHWAVVAQAEDLNVSAILTLKGEWETHAIYANEFPMGPVQSASSDNHIIFYGEEYRSNPYGHVALIGLDHLIQPISSGGLGELGGPDYPPNSYVLEDALDQGATTIGAHFGNFITQGEQIKTPWPSTGFEMPADVALGKIRMAEIFGNGGQVRVWYDLLNCGFRIPATAGPDWAIRDSPRVYVNLGEKPFNLDNWITNLEAGKSFITQGPMIFFTVDGKMPGADIEVSGETVNVSIDAEALVPDGSLPVEIVFNGNVIASGKDLKTTLTLDDSGWLAARCEGAHSNPVYVNFESRPAGLAAPARKFIEITEQLVEWVKTKGLFYTDDQRAEMLEVLRQGQEVYQAIANRATALGRE